MSGLLHADPAALCRRRHARIVELAVHATSQPVEKRVEVDQAAGSGVAAVAGGVHSGDGGGQRVMHQILAGEVGEGVVGQVLAHPRQPAGPKADQLKAVLLGDLVEVVVGEVVGCC